MPRPRKNKNARPLPYPKPGRIGGRLIRQVVARLRAAEIDLPITSHILIGISGGSDSVALAHLLTQYGRRVAGEGQISFLHVNHGWRGAASLQDERFVRQLGKKWGVPVIVHRLSPPDPQKLDGASWEDVARQARKAIYAEESQTRQAIVLTAHQADDVAETLLWRLLTGAAKTHGGGIALKHGAEIRPLIGIRKSELQAYLREEKVRWREDSTNHSGRFLRSKMRSELMPVIERLFPRAVSHLVELAIAAQRDQIKGAATDTEALGALFEASGLKIRRGHWSEIQKLLGTDTSRGKVRTSGGEVHLPGGWKLKRERGEPGRWVLEKTLSSA